MNHKVLGRIALLSLGLGACVDRVANFDDSALPAPPTPNPQSAGATNGGSGGSGAAPPSAGAGGSSQPPSGGAGMGGSSGPPPGGEAGAPGGGANDGGGAGGEAGAAPAPPILDFIDEVELGFPRLPLREGRNGAWFGVHDASGGFAPEPSALALVPARGVSHHAARFAGGGFTSWGAQVGVSLKSPANGYDASHACGIHFVAKGFGEGWTVLLSDRLSSPNGGICNPDAADVTQRCYDHLGQSFAPSEAWRTYDISFAELRPFKGFTVAERPLEKAALFDVIFNFENPNGAPFELLVDDLALSPCAED